MLLTVFTRVWDVIQCPLFMLLALQMEFKHMLCYKCPNASTKKWDKTDESQSKRGRELTLKEDAKDWLLYSPIGGGPSVRIIIDQVNRLFEGPNFHPNVSMTRCLFPMKGKTYEPHA